LSFLFQFVNKFPVDVGKLLQIFETITLFDGRRCRQS